MRRGFLGIIFLFTLFIGHINMGMASHILGAELSYVCLGQDTSGKDSIEVHLTLLWECVGFSSPDGLNICYRSPACGVNTIRTLNRIDSSTTTPLCSLYKNICDNGLYISVEKKLYTGILVLAPCSDWRFGFEYGSRDATTTNIFNPGAETVTIECRFDNLNYPCNNSPVYNSYPFAYICSNQPVIYNLGAFDLDGDSLVYSLFPPLTNNVQCIPNDTVNYKPGFSFQQPLTSVPPVKLDSFTGELTMTPTVAGEITVFGIQISEYRNGNLMGFTTRDFPVYIDSCSNAAPLLTGIDSSSMYIDTICSGPQYCFDIYGVDPDSTQMLIISLDSNEITNASVNATGSSPLKATFCWQPVLVDTGLAIFTVSIQDNGCIYNLRQLYTYQIFVEPGFVVDIGQDRFLPCGNTDTITVVATGGHPSKSNLWKTGDTTTSVIINSPGTYSIVVTDGNGCFNYDTIIIFKNLDADFSSNSACVGDSTIFIDSSSTLSGTIVSWAWDLGDGSTSSIQNPAHVYGIDSTYKVRLIITDNLGCKDTIVQDVIVHPLPKPEFTFTQNGLTVTFKDASPPVIGWFWDFGDGNSSSSQNTMHTYTNAGSYNVCLTVVDSNSCSDSVCKNILFTYIQPTHQELKDQFIIYPGVVTDQLFIRSTLPFDQRIFVQIFNSIGLKVDERQLRLGKDQTTRIDVSSFQSGLYLIALQTNLGRNVYKIIIAN